MGKIKVNLASGNVFEKPLVTCYQGSSANYIVFDNEMNGSMGLPIICISKLSGNKLEKIYDQSEWTSVKENLKSIISGTPMMYLSVPDNLTAQDDFFTQLTLPVASFDVLKNNYNPPVQTPVMETPQVSPAPVETITPVTPTVENTVQNVGVSPNANLNNPVNFGGINMMQPPVMETPKTEMNFESQPLMQNFEPTPVVNTVQQNHDSTNTIDYSDLKQTFMKSCENMFDALVKKFENK